MISVRLLKAKDLEAYRAARLTCLLSYTNSFGTTYEEEINKEQLLFDTFLQSEDPNNFLFGAFDQNQCIGLCGFLRNQRRQLRHAGGPV